MVHPRRLHRLPVLVLLAAGLATGAACAGSGSGSGDGVASIKTASDKKSGAEEAAKKDETKTNPEDAMLDFARCMREHGVDMPDPDTERQRLRRRHLQRRRRRHQSSTPTRASSVRPTRPART